MSFGLRSMRHSLAVIALLGMAGVGPVGAAQAQVRSLDTERAQESYLVGMDVGRSLQAVAPHMDLAVFEATLSSVIAGGDAPLDAAAAQATGEALMRSLSANPSGAASSVAAPARDKVGQLLGADIGRSLRPLNAEIDLPVTLQAMRTVLTSGSALLTDEQAQQVRQRFSQRIGERHQAERAALAERNRSEGEAFLEQNRSQPGVFVTRTGLQYQVLQQGQASGARARLDSKVKVHYEGRLLNGNVFDSSIARGEPTEFGLNQVIPGWTEGVALMPVGAKYRFWIPSELAYGQQGAGADIGPNQTLVFDVELLDILN